MSDTPSFRTVLLPGLACDAGLWRDQLAALAPRYAPRVADVHTRADTLPAMARQLLAEQSGELMAAADLRRALPGVGCPTLVVCGEGDAITPPKCSREMAAAIPAARLEWLPECGHMPTMEKPAAVNALLQAWLGSLEHISAPGGSG